HCAYTTLFRSLRADVCVPLEVRMVVDYPGVEHRPADVRAVRHVCDVGRMRLDGMNGCVEQRVLSRVAPDAPQHASLHARLGERVRKLLGFGSREPGRDEPLQWLDAEILVVFPESRELDDMLHDVSTCVVERSGSRFRGVG